MLIAHLVSQKPYLTGSGTFYSRFVEEASRRGYQNLAVYGTSAVDPTELVTPGISAEVRIDYGSRPIVGMSDVMPYPSRRFRDLSPLDYDEYVRAIDEALTRARGLLPDDAVILSHHLWVLTARARALLDRWPVGGICHGSDLAQCGKCGGIASRVRSQIQRLNAVLVPSRTVADDVVEQFDVDPERVHVIGAAIDGEIFHSRRRASRGSSRGRVVLFVGKLSVEKGLDVLLDVLPSIEDARLVVVGDGDGPEADALKARMSAMPRVEYRGRLAPEAVGDAMRDADLFVLPSLHEGLGLTILEALACGCRVVASELSSVREFLGDAARRSDWIRWVPLGERSLGDPARGRSAYAESLAAALVSFHDTDRVGGGGEEAPASMVAACSWREVFARAMAALLDGSRTDR